MIEETARVLACFGEVAEVETSSHSASCGACEARGGCGASALARLFGKRVTRLRVLNPVGARPGERVVIGLPERAVLRASLLLYLVPVCGLVAGAVAARWWAQGLGLGGGDAGALLGAILGLTGGLLWARHSVRDALGVGGVQPVVLRRGAGVRWQRDLPSAERD